MNLGFEPAPCEMRRKISQNRSDYYEISIERVHRFDVAVDGQAADQTVWAEGFTRLNETGKIRRATLRRQLVDLQRRHPSLLYLPLVRDHEK